MHAERVVHACRLCEMGAADTCRRQRQFLLVDATHNTSTDKVSFYLYFRAIIQVLTHTFYTSILVQVELLIIYPNFLETTHYETKDD